MNAINFGACGFGWLVLNGQRYAEDLLIAVDGEIVPRPKHLSKKYGGWHTALGPEEVECALTGAPELLLVGCGHFGILPIRRETRKLLTSRGVQLETRRIRGAMKRYAELTHTDKRVAAILHLAC